MVQEEQTKQLIKNLESLNEELEKSNSVLHNLGLSIVKGVGTLIGATIVATLLLGILSQIIQSANDIPILNKVIDTEKVNEYFQTDN